MKKIFAVLCLFFAAPAAWSVERVDDVVFLINEEYLSVLRESIREAKQNIYIEMYLIRPGPSDDHPVNTLITDLSAARKRGVQVKILLDRHFEKDNEKAVSRLKSGGVWDVEFDDSGRINHTKLVVIDDETLIVGSQNWTLSALASSNESAVFVRNRDVVAELKKKLRRQK